MYIIFPIRCIISSSSSLNNTQYSLKNRACYYQLAGRTDAFYFSNHSFMLVVKNRPQVKNSGSANKIIQNNNFLQ